MATDPRPENPGRGAVDPPRPKVAVRRYPPACCRRAAATELQTRGSNAGKEGSTAGGQGELEHRLRAGLVGTKVARPGRVGRAGRGHMGICDIRPNNPAFQVS